MFATKDIVCIASVFIYVLSRENILVLIMRFIRQLRHVTCASWPIYTSYTTTTRTTEFNMTQILANHRPSHSMVPKSQYWHHTVGEFCQKTSHLPYKYIARSVKSGKTWSCLQTHTTPTTVRVKESSGVVLLYNLYIQYSFSTQGIIIIYSVCLAYSCSDLQRA